MKDLNEDEFLQVNINNIENFNSVVINVSFQKIKYKG